MLPELRWQAAAFHFAFVLQLSYYVGDIRVKLDNLKIHVNEGCEIFLVTVKNHNKRGYKLGCFGLYDQ